MSKKTKKTLDDILENAIATDFEGDLPGDDSKPDFNSLPKLDRELYQLDRNDYCNGKRLVARFGKDLMFLYDAEWAAWNGKLWSIKDGNYIANRLAGETAEAMKGEVTALWVEGRRADEDEDKFKKRLKAFHKFAVSCGNYGRQRNMLINSQDKLLTDSNELDLHHDLLNLQNGTLNLNAGEVDAAEDCGEQENPRIVLQKHNRKHKITRIANTEYKPGKGPREFEKFIHQIMPDDEVRLFLQRWFGYALTGHANEQKMLMFTGKGSNGKSVLLKIMEKVLGDFAMRTPFKTIMREDKGNDAAPDIARLPGSRLLIVSEPPKNAELDDGIVKTLTGEDGAPVRNIYEGYFEFDPTFKICLACNNKPYIRATDDGIWRRILVVDFKEKFVHEEDLPKWPKAHLVDKDLEKKMRDEYPEILNWMIEGYRMWKDIGLSPPPRVQEESAKYRHESNQAYPFFMAWCERREGAKIQAKRLYEAYQLWAKLNGREAVAGNTFGTKMAALNVEKKESNYHFWLDIQLTPEAEDNLLAEERKTWYGKDK